MIEIKIGGVPEHFNLAWYLTLKNGEYKNEGINLRWTDYPGGTGEMCKALKNKEIDLASDQQTVEEGTKTVDTQGSMG